MKNTWQLQEAKNKFSEVVEEAVQHGAQIVTKRGEPTAVVLSYDEYRKLKQPKDDLATFFAKSPLSGLELELKRSKDTGRKVEF